MVASVHALRVASSIISRAALAVRAGVTFGGKRDTYKALGYERVLLPKDYRARYRRGGVAARVVEALPKATWRGGAELIEDQDPTTTTEFEEAFVELDNRLGIWAVCMRADVLAGLGNYSVILLGAPGELDTELPKTVKAEQLAYLQAFSEEDCLVSKFDDDSSSERFGLPVEYQFNRGASTVRQGAAQVKFSRTVHWTRVIHVADEALDDRVNGTPRLERVWNYLDDLDKVVGGGAEAFWKRADRGLIFEVDPELQMDEEEANKVQEATDELLHDMRRTLAVRGMKPMPLGSDVANFAAPLDAVLTLIAGASGIPKRILAGSERGELASTQDRENWETRVTDRRHDFAEPVVVRPLVQRLMDRKVLPQVEEYIVQWPEIESLTEVERADVATKWAGLNTASGDTVVLPAEIRDKVLRLEPIKEEDLAAYEEKKAEEAEAQMEAQRQSMEDAAKIAGKMPKPGGPPPAPGKKPAFGKPRAASNPCHDPKSGQFCETGKGGKLTAKQHVANVNQSIREQFSDQGREAPQSISRIPSDRLKREIERAEADGDDTVTVKIPSYSEVNMSLDEARAVLGELGNDDDAPWNRRRWGRAPGKKEPRGLSNQCHEPGGSSIGGQFCSPGGKTAGGQLGAPSSAYPASNPAGVDTMTRFQDAQGNWTPERQALHQAIIDSHFVGKTPVAAPTAIMLGGGPASGKSTVTSNMELDPNTVKIDVDHIRKKLPEYGEGLARGDSTVSTFTHEESSYISKQVLKRASEGQYNTLLDGTGDSGYNSLAAKIGQMKAGGAKVRGIYVNLDTNTAIARSKARAANPKSDSFGRTVPESFMRQSHAAVSRVVPAAIDAGLYDSFELWDTTGRSGKLVFTYEKGVKTMHDADLWAAFVAKGAE